MNIRVITFLQPISNDTSSEWICDLWCPNMKNIDDYKEYPDFVVIENTLNPNELAVRNIHCYKDPKQELSITFLGFKK